MSKANLNALQHGAYGSLSRSGLDGRTRVAKALDCVEAELICALGNEPSPQELMLIKSAATKFIRCLLLRGQILSHENPKADWEKQFIRWSRDLREDLKTIGLQRREKQIAADLDTYIEAEYGT